MQKTSKHQFGKDLNSNIEVAHRENNFLEKTDPFNSNNFKIEMDKLTLFCST